MKQMLTEMKPSDCPVCLKENTVYAQQSNSSYNLLSVEFSAGQPFNSRIYGCKCKNCNTEFGIEWINVDGKHIPYPTPKTIMKAKVKKAFNWF